MTPTTVVDDATGAVVAAEPESAEAESSDGTVEGVVFTCVKSRPRITTTSPVATSFTGWSSAPESRYAATVRAAPSWPFA